MPKTRLIHNEIGGEFWEVPISNEQNSIFPESTQWFLSGRSALQSIIKGLPDFQTVAIPSWCCESMIKAFVNAGKEIHFYPIYCGECLTQEIDLNSDVLLLMDYFGYTSSTPNVKDYKGIIIRDMTHSIFSSSYNDADYYFGSLRKWCGVWTGGFAWKRDGHFIPMETGDDYGFTAFREKAMKLKNSYIHGWGVTDKGYLKVFEEAEQVLENVSVGFAADRDIALAQNVDVAYIKTQRRKNAEILRKAFPDWLIFSKLSTQDTPMFVPVIVPNGQRDSLRHYLIKNEIYCPIHWPVSEYHNMDKRTTFIYENELSLVCDQRYTEEDMNRMVETIRFFMEDM